METIIINSENYREKYEIERGKPMPSKNHSFIQSRINKLIDRTYPDTVEILPELSIAISKDGREKVPDLAIYRYGDITFDVENDELRVQKMPLGAVEILSPNQNIVDLVAKSHAYFEEGILSYWLVIPRLKSIYVFSGKSEYEVYAKTDILKDTQLKIEMDLGVLFTKK